MQARAVPIFWRVFAVNAGLLALIAVLLLVSPVEISYPIKPIQALIVVVGLAITLVANVLLLRRAVAPLERLVERMDRVDLLRPGQRLQVSRDDEIGRVVRAFNQMLDRLESERQCDTSLPKLEPDTELAVYRIAQESLTNVARHANASGVTIALERGHDSVVLRVTDDGRGFNSATPEEQGGLRSMRERALLVD